MNKPPIGVFEIPAELSYALFHEDVISRPPQEAASALLEVSLGCSYSGCIFCEEEARQRFHVNTMAEIQTKLDLLATIPGIEQRRSLFLVGEDALCLPMPFLCTLFAAIRQTLPAVRQINLYARAEDVLAKGEKNLRQLKELGLGDLYVGVESGSDRILAWCKKMVDSARMKQAFDLLDSLDIAYSLSSILGLGGQQGLAEHAIATARFYSSIHPKSIRVMTLTPYAGTTLAQEVEEGRFIELTPGQVLLEERLFLEHLNLSRDCLFIGNNVSNNVSLLGILPHDKQLLIEQLEEALLSRDPAEWQRKEFEIM